MGRGKGNELGRGEGNERGREGKMRGEGKERREEEGKGVESYATN